MMMPSALAGLPGKLREARRRQREVRPDGKAVR